MPVVAQHLNVIYGILGFVCLSSSLRSSRTYPLSIRRRCQSRVGAGPYYSHFHCDTDYVVHAAIAMGEEQARRGWPPRYALTAS